MVYRMIFLLVFVLTSHLSASAQVVFPEMEATDLNGKNWSLPEDAEGKVSIIGMALSKDAEGDLKSWYGPMYDKFIMKSGIFDHLYDVNFFFIPIFTGAAKLAYDQCMSQLKAGNEESLFPYILFSKAETKEAIEALQMTDKKTPYLFVLDEQGKIIYATQGSFSEKKMSAIEAILDERL